MVWVGRDLEDPPVPAPRDLQPQTGRSDNAQSQSKEAIRRALSKLHQFLMGLSTALGSAIPNLGIPVPHTEPGAARKAADPFQDLWGWILPVQNQAGAGWELPPAGMEPCAPNKGTLPCQDVAGRWGGAMLGADRPPPKSSVCPHGHAQPPSASAGHVRPAQKQRGGLESEPGLSAHLCDTRSPSKAANAGPQPRACVPRDMSSINVFSSPFLFKIGVELLLNRCVGAAKIFAFLLAACLASVHGRCQNIPSSLPPAASISVQGKGMPGGGTLLTHTQGAKFRQLPAVPTSHLHPRPLPHSLDAADETPQGEQHQSDAEDEGKPLPEQHRPSPPCTDTDPCRKLRPVLGLGTGLARQAHGFSSLARSCHPGGVKLKLLPTGVLSARLPEPTRRLEPAAS